MLYFYNNKVLDNKTFYPQSDREKVINPLNCDAWFSIHNGSGQLTQYKSSDYCINKKLGMFVKTRKPFFFRSKKKKN